MSKRFSVVVGAANWYVGFLYDKGKCFKLLFHSFPIVMAHIISTMLKLETMLALLLLERRSKVIM